MVASLREVYLARRWYYDDKRSTVRGPVDDVGSSRGPVVGA